MNEKSIECLKMASLPKGSVWEKEYDRLCLKYSEKAVIRKMESLDRLGYIESGVSSRTGWLTEKGRTVLVELK